jgi:hypothetical protein
MALGAHRHEDALLEFLGDMVLEVLDQQVPKGCHCVPIGLRGSVNRRVAYASRHDGKAIESLCELSSIKSCQPIGGSSKTRSDYIMD